jgi:hypothetical protein
MTEDAEQQELSTADLAGTTAQRYPVADDGTAPLAQSTPLLASEAAQEFRSRWEGIQTGFVDEPRRAVEEADSLVADLMTRLAQSFSEERKGLESQWDRGDDVSTEDLRIALQRYRGFFQRLLSA